MRYVNILAIISHSNYNILVTAMYKNYFHLLLCYFAILIIILLITFVYFWCKAYRLIIKNYIVYLLILILWHIY